MAIPFGPRPIAFGSPISLATMAPADIYLSGYNVYADVAPGTVVGAIVSNGPPGALSFALTNDAGGMFALAGKNIVVGMTPLNHLTTPAPTIAVKASNGAQSVSRDLVLSVRQPLPKNATSLTFASNRVSFPLAVQTAGASDKSALGHSYHVAPEYGVGGGMRLLFSNFYIETSGGRNPEKKPGNAKTVDFATVFVGATAYPVTFGGAQSVVIPDGGFVWSDVVMNGGAELTMPARQAYYVRVSESLAQGERRTFLPGSQMEIGRWANWSTGDGVEFTSTPQAGKRLTGSVGGYSGGSQMVAPAMIVAKGWDGSAVYAIFGDSIGASQADFGSDLSNRGVLGHIGLALDDLASGRRSYANLCVPGTKPQDQSENSDGQFRLRLSAIRALPNQPFNSVISRMGQNGIFTGFGEPGNPVYLPEFGQGQPNNLQAAMRKWWSFLKDQFGAQIHQLTVTPRTQNGTSNMIWTDPAAQLPTDIVVDGLGGYRMQFNEWLVSSGQLPAYVTVLDDREAFYDIANPIALRKIDGDWTLEAATVAGTTSFNLVGPVAPKQGDVIAFEPGTANADLRSSYRITGTGPWTVYVTGGGKAHAAGALVKVASSPDGLHPGHSLHLLGRDILVAKKTAGMLP